MTRSKPTITRSTQARDKKKLEKAFAQRGLSRQKVERIAEMPEQQDATPTPATRRRARRK